MEDLVRRRYDLRVDEINCNATGCSVQYGYKANNELSVEPGL